ncbi:hypothetical protein K3495_g6541 [Podosphaera aphanis]|nr:hypothetical protein K3495_g6541 [Podosphaera aphanis]
MTTTDRSSHDQIQFFGLPTITTEKLYVVAIKDEAGDIQLDNDIANANSFIWSHHTVQWL